MEKRRQFLKKTLGFVSAVSLLFTPLFSLLRVVYAETKRIILPKGTKRQSLAQKNPKHLDTRNLEITPLKDFETMGLDDHEVNPDQWRLHIDGRVKEPQKLTYTELKAMPSIERKVLLICPGVFAIYGRWKGISMERLLQRSGIDKDATHVTFDGPEGDYEKVERFPLEEILSGKVFLAYEVNGKPLPTKHGFPLRLVAEDHYGNDWVKYVYKVTVVNQT